MVPEHGIVQVAANQGMAKEESVGGLDESNVHHTRPSTVQRRSSVGFTF